MRRLLRISHTIVTVISLVLAILMVSLWIRSYFFQDAITHISRNRAKLVSSFTSLYTECGRCKFSIARRTFNAQEGFDYHDGFLIPPPTPRWHEGWSYEAAHFANAGPWFQNEAHDWASTPASHYSGRY